jgi:chemotaxis protein CheX
MTAEPPQPAAASALDPKLIAPFVASIRSVFSTMVGVEATIQRPYLKTDQTATFTVSSIIGFSGQVLGSVTLSFQDDAAKKLVAKFAGAEMDIQSPDFADAIGELANMVAGAAKKDLGGSASITVPSVVIGPGHHIARLRDVPCVVIPCTSPVGDFTVEVSIKRVTN